MSDRAKVLVMGHSWVQYVQEENLRNPIQDFELNFAFEEGIRIDGLIEMVPIVLTPEHTHVLLFSLLTDALYVQSIGPRSERKSYQLLVPNRDFNPEYFAQRMNAFTERCKMINPQVRVILMIPPVIDLVRHNRIRVDSYPQNIQRSYMENPQFDDRLLYMCMMDLNSSMAILKGKQFPWLDKRVYPLQYVAQLIHPVRIRLGQFMKGEIFTLGKAGHLCDGFHPTTAFIEKMWTRIRSTNLLNIFKAPTTFKQINTPPQKMKVKKRKFDFPPPVEGESSQQYDNSSSSIITKKLSPPPVPPHFSSSHIQNTKFRQDDEEENHSRSVAQPTHSMDMVSSTDTSQQGSAQPRLQLVDVHYMRAEIDKFSSFMAGHAHAVGQNLSIREIKQMMIATLQEQL